MPTHLGILGLNHRSAPLDVREKVAFPAEAQGDALAELVATPGVAEAVLLSTCNRTEVYFRAEDEGAVRAWLVEAARRSGVELASHLYSHAGDEAVRHAFRVAAGLDSMVLGEPQILGQVKQSVRTAEGAGAIGATLSRLFQNTFAVAKQVRTETTIGSQSISMAAASLRLAQNLFGDLSRTTLLLVGAGEMVELAATYFVAQRPREIVVANRTLERAEALAERYGAQAIALSELPQRFATFDLVVTATASPTPIIGRALVEGARRARKRRPIFIVDLAVPRDVEADVAGIDDVFLYTVDDLGKIVEEGAEARRSAVTQAESIVEQQVRVFREWQGSRAAVPAIVELRRRAEAYSGAELARAKSRLAKGDSPEAVLESLARGISNKFLHHPTQALTRAPESEREALARAMRQLFPDSDEDAAGPA